MKVEIWSDIMCPFCYIGKRRLEAAMAGFEGAGDMEVEWSSFQLNPDLKYQPEKDLYTYVAEMKGQTREWSIEVHKGLVQYAKELGLDYRFDIAKIANSFDAHRLIQYAKSLGLGDAMEERLFHAYFTKGALISDHGVLLNLATEISLDATETSAVLASNSFSEAVSKDCIEAQRLGATGVPFFVFNRKFAVSGAQPIDVFSKALEKAFKDWQVSQEG